MHHCCLNIFTARNLKAGCNEMPWLKCMGGDLHCLKKTFIFHNWRGGGDEKFALISWTLKLCYCVVPCLQDPELLHTENRNIVSLMIFLRKKRKFYFSRLLGYGVVCSSLY
jgi:hypothetical protein